MSKNKNDKNQFVGRKPELAYLESLRKKKSASLVAIKGRRRVGKSRLVAQFAKGKSFYKFTGLAPVEGLTAQDQRDEFAEQLTRQTGFPVGDKDTWSSLFLLLAKIVSGKDVIILFDELSWMAEGDRTFLPKLKNAWDDDFSQNPKLMLVLCSSISMWFEDEVLSSTGFLGRISWTCHLSPLSLQHANELLEYQGFRYPSAEKFKVLSITGGIPWYIEHIQGEYHADENIRRLCFEPGGVLVEEFDKIFHDLFEKKDVIYKKIIMALRSKPLSYDEVAQEIDYPKSGRLSDYLRNLEKAGFVSLDNTWSLRTGAAKKLATYRLSDNYIRYYLHYIMPRREDIKHRRIGPLALSHLPGWNSIVGLQFENLVISNRHALYAILNISPESVVYDNPFFQTKTTRQKGCQIDFLIQTRFNTLYAIEIKFSGDPIGSSVVEEVAQKVERISLPRQAVVLPVLIHVNGVTPAVEASGCFHRIIDFSELLDLS